MLFSYKFWLMTATNFYECHDSCALKACPKVCTYLMARDCPTAKSNFHWNWITEKIVSEMGPGTFQWTFNSSNICLIFIYDWNYHIAIIADTIMVLGHHCWRQRFHLFKVSLANYDFNLLFADQMTPLKWLRRFGKMAQHFGSSQRSFFLAATHYFPFCPLWPWAKTDQAGTSIVTLTHF